MSTTDWLIFRDSFHWSFEEDWSRLQITVAVLYVRAIVKVDSLGEYVSYDAVCVPGVYEIVPTIAESTRTTIRNEKTVWKGIGANDRRGRKRRGRRRNGICIGGAEGVGRNRDIPGSHQMSFE